MGPSPRSSPRKICEFPSNTFKACPPPALDSRHAWPSSFPSPAEVGTPNGPQEGVSGAGWPGQAPSPGETGEGLRGPACLRPGLPALEHLVLERPHSLRSTSVCSWGVPLGGEGLRAPVGSGALATNGQGPLRPGDSAHEPSHPGLWVSLLERLLLREQPTLGP